MDFETRAIHDGQEPDPATGSVIPPIYQTSTFVQDAVGVNKGYDYARVANPTRTALEGCLASLENAAHGHAFSSGLGATTSVMHLLDPGDRVVCVNDVYGGTYRMFSQVYEPKGWRFTYATPAELSADPAALVSDARLVWLETPTNPLLNVVDIAAVAAATRAAVRTLHDERGASFLEVHVATPVEVCSERDVKGLYAQQRAGQLTGLTGVDAPYEAPDAPDARIPTQEQSLAQSVDQLLAVLVEKGLA